MPPADIKQFRNMLRIALQMGGFSPKKLEPKMPLAWTLPADEVVPVFFPHEIRRPWGFRLSGSLGIELPALTAWLQARYAREARGIFRHSFTTYHIANDPEINDFAAIFGEEIALNSWVERPKQRTTKLPTTVDALCETYRAKPDALGLFAWDISTPAWDWLLQWHADPDHAPPVPQSLF